jgi:hypothetical protein
MLPSSPGFQLDHLLFKPTRLPPWPWTGHGVGIALGLGHRCAGANLCVELVLSIRQREPTLYPGFIPRASHFRTVFRWTRR